MAVVGIQNFIVICHTQTWQLTDNQATTTLKQPCFIKTNVSTTGADPLVEQQTIVYLKMTKKN